MSRSAAVTGNEPAPDAAPAATVGDAYARLAARFREAALDTPALDARRLVAAALGVEAAMIIQAPERPLTEAEAGRIGDFGARRLEREPVSRIVGQRSFFGLELELGVETLDPRPDTETLVEGVLRLVATHAFARPEGPARILDLGTGSGAILLALLAALPMAEGIGTDQSAAALATAAANARRHGLETRARFAQADWLAGLSGRFELVVSNPPYVPSADIAGLEPEVREHDPLAALDGGADGLDAYRAIVAGIGDVLAPGAWMVLEVGTGQAGPVATLATASGLFRPRRVEDDWVDLGGVRRCVAFQAR